VAIAGPPYTAATERKRDEYIGKIEGLGVESLAGYRSALSKRDPDRHGCTAKANTRRPQPAVICR
jgi:hypothetical protein